MRRKIGSRNEEVTRLRQSSSHGRTSTHSRIKPQSSQDKMSSVHQWVGHLANWSLGKLALIPWGSCGGSLCNRASGREWAVSLAIPSLSPPASPQTTGPRSPPLTKLALWTWSDPCHRLFKYRLFFSFYSFDTQTDRAVRSSPYTQSLHPHPYTFTYSLCLEWPLPSSWRIKPFQCANYKNYILKN